MTPTKKKPSHPHTGHRQRVKQRFLREGLDSFSDLEALELLLFFAIPMKDTNETARALLAHFGSFSSVLEADVQELCQIPNIGENAAFLLRMLPEFFRRYAIDRQGARPLLDTLEQVAQYSLSLFVGSLTEDFYLICLNARRELLRCVCVSRGTVNQVAVQPRIAVETALRYHADAVILAHNHPSGDASPSSDDVVLTKTMMQAMHTVNILVIDHIIVCGNAFASMANLGLIPNRY